jgi:hypothetical protein
MLLHCITTSDSEIVDDSPSESFNGRARLYSVRTMQLLTAMCSSSQNCVSVLALDTICQLVSLPAISIFAAPLVTRSTRVYVTQLEAALKSAWGSAGIKAVRDAVVAADSRAAAASAALSLRCIFRDTWGSNWCVSLFHI